MAGLADLLGFGGGANIASNPFQRASGGDPWQGLREVQAPLEVSQPGPLAQPTSQMQPTSTPAYNPLMASDGPLARAGWIGALIAQGPSQAEHQLQQGGRAQQQAITGIGQRIQQGMAPQRAILDFANSPEGQEFFVTGGGFSDLTNIVKGVSPAPLPDPIVMSPGQMAFQPGANGMLNPVGAVPVNEVQKVQSLAEMGNLTRDEQATVARSMLAKDMAGDLSASEAAIGRLVETGRITRETGDLILGGVLSPTPILDAAGNTVGYGVKDLSSNGVTMLPSATDAGAVLPEDGKSSNYAEGITPGSKPEEQAGKDNQPSFQGMENPADITDSAGPVGWLIEKLGTVAGLYSPEFAPVETVRNRKALGRIKADAQQLGKEGRVLASEMEEISALADTIGFNTTPELATQTLISLHDSYDNAEKRLNELMNDPGKNVTAKVRGGAAIDLANLRRARANLPTRESLTMKMQQQMSAAPLETITNAVSEGEKRAANAGLVDDGRKPMEYKDMNSLRGDWQSGKLRKGMTVTINGKSYPITRDFKE